MNKTVTVSYRVRVHAHDEKAFKEAIKSLKEDAVACKTGSLEYNNQPFPKTVKVYLEQSLKKQKETKFEIFANLMSFGLLKRKLKEFIEHAKEVNKHTYCAKCVKVVSKLLQEAEKWEK